MGHHAGDQVETTLFRFSRASGIDGLAGIQSLGPLGVLAGPEALDIRVVRPLLQVSKVCRVRVVCDSDKSGFEVAQYINCYLFMAIGPSKGNV